MEKYLSYRRFRRFIRILVFFFILIPLCSLGSNMHRLWGSQNAILNEHACVFALIFLLESVTCMLSTETRLRKPLGESIGLCITLDVVSLLTLLFASCITIFMPLHSKSTIEQACICVLFNSFFLSLNFICTLIR